MSQPNNDPAQHSPELDALLSLGEGDERVQNGDDWVDGSIGNLDDQTDQTAYAESAADVLAELAIDSVTPNRYQPRREFEPDALARLAESIGALGVLQPIVVRPGPAGSYELIAGERRWRAARLAGRTSVPALIRSASDRQSLEEAIVENLHRSDLNVLEEAAGYERLMSDFGLTQDEVAQRVGKSRSAVANILRLVQLPAEVKEMLVDGRLSAGHARALLGLPTQAERRNYASYTVKNGLSARQVEELVRSGRDIKSNKGSGAGSGTKGKPAAALEVEQMMADRLSTKVEVRTTAGKGQLIVSFADLEDLGRIYELLLGSGSDEPE